MLVGSLTCTTSTRRIPSMPQITTAMFTAPKRKNMNVSPPSQRA